MLPKPAPKSVPSLGIFRLAVAGAVIMAGCDTGPAPSLYDPDAESAPDPVITSVDPEGAALAGVDIVTIVGSNFSGTAGDNLVYFGDTRGDLLQASTTSLSVRPPNTPQPELELRVAVIGAENFSNAVQYRLEAAAEDFGKIAAFEEPFAITSDDEGNLFVSLFSDNRSVGVIRMAPDGARSTYVETTFKWDAMEFGPDGALYAARGVRAIFRFTEGSSQETWAVIQDSAVRIRALAFDAHGNLWAGGPNSGIFRIAPDKSIRQFGFEPDVTDLVVAGGVLYAAASEDGTSQVVRLPILASGDLGTAEALFSVSDARVHALAVAATGEVLVGTDAVDPVYVVQTDGSADVLYPGILTPAAVSFAWGAGTALYMTRGKTDSTTPNLVRVNVRRARG